MDYYHRPSFLTVRSNGSDKTLIFSFFPTTVEFENNYNVQPPNKGAKKVVVEELVVCWCPCGCCLLAALA
jgi:hypothetical protein